MKNTFKLFGIIVLVAIIGFSMTACPSDGGSSDGGGSGGGNSKLTVSGLPGGSDWAVYIFTGGTDVSSYQKIVDAWASSNWQAVGAITPQTGSNVFKLYSWNGTTQTEEWQGSGVLPVILIRWDGTNMVGSFFNANNPVYRHATISFSNGSGAINFNNFSAVLMESLTINDLPSRPAGTYSLFIYPESTDLSTIEKANAAFTAMNHSAVGVIMTALGGLANQFALFNWTGAAQAGAFTGNGNFKALLIDMTEVLNMEYSLATVNFIKGVGTAHYFDFEYIGDPVFEYSGTTELTITGYKGPQIVEIPASINGKSVTAIGINVFRSKGLTSVTIPNSVTIIGGNAFWNNRLTSITIPSSVTTIGEGAFWNNQLTSVTIPSSVTTIWDGAFGSNQLTSVTIPNSVTNTGNKTFENNQLTSITIPSSVTTIGNSSFSYNRLTSVNIPNSVTTIGESAFANNQLTSVTLPSSVTNTGNKTFENNQLTSITIPSSVTTIGESAFNKNKLTSVTIPSSVTTIGESAFANNQLTSVTIPNSVTTIGESAFANNQLTSITIPSSVTTIIGGVYNPNIGSYSGAFLGNQYLTSITIGANVNLTDLAQGTPYLDNFDNVYITGGKLAGTYTRPPNSGATAWVKQ